MPPKTLKNDGDVSKYTVVELREKLTGLGLSATGLKPDLVARLEKAIKSGDKKNATDDASESDDEEVRSKKRKVETEQKKPRKAAKTQKKKKDSEDDDEESEEEKPVKSKSRKGKSKKESSDEEEEEEEPEPKSRKGKAKKQSSDDEEEDDEEEEEDAKPVRSSKRKAAEKAEEEDNEKTSGAWKKEGSLLVLDSSSITPNEHIVAFDMDDTLIKTKSKRVHANSRTDWQWLLPEVLDKLKSLNKEGVKVAIFTNQGGIHGKGGYDQTKANQITGKIIDIIAQLGFPVQAFVATTDDQYRKPGTAMWDYMVKNHNGGLKPDLEKSYYVGDAAGRAANWAPGRKKDFSDSDRKFANNIGCKFATPEEYFLGHAAVEYKLGGFDLNSVPAEGSEFVNGGLEKLISKKNEVVVFVGFPGSGKSTIAKKHFVPAGYEHVNRDTLKTPAKCLKVAREALEAGKSVVVDNTNPTVAGRSEYIDLAKEFDASVRCVQFTATKELANHLNYYRERKGESKHVSSIAYNVYKKNFQEPTTEEGFEEVLQLNFVPDFSSTSESDKELFTQLAPSK